MFGFGVFFMTLDSDTFVGPDLNLVLFLTKNGATSLFVKPSNHSFFYRISIRNFNRKL